MVEAEGWGWEVGPRDTEDVQEMERGTVAIREGNRAFPGEGSKAEVLNTACVRQILAFRRDPLPSCPAVALAWGNSQKQSYAAQALSSPPNGKLSLLRIREFAYNLAVERIKH